MIHFIDLIKWINPTNLWANLRQKPRIIKLEQETDKLKQQLAEQHEKEKATIPDGFEYDSVKRIFYSKDLNMHICPSCWAEHGIKNPVTLKKNNLVYWSCQKCKSYESNPGYRPPQVRDNYGY